MLMELAKNFGPQTAMFIAAIVAMWRVFVYFIKIFLKFKIVVT